MSNDNAQDEVEFEEVVDELVEFDEEVAIQTSRNIVADMLLIDHVPVVDDDGKSVLDNDGNTETLPIPMFVAVRPQMNEDGSLIFICTSDMDSDNVVVHTVFSAYMKRDELFSAPEMDSGIVDSEGKPLSSDDTSTNIVGLNGETISR